MVRITMNAKIMIAIIATFAMLFAGVAVADSSDAEETPMSKNTVEFYVDGVTYTTKLVKEGENNMVLPDLAYLGATLEPGKEFKGWYIGDETEYENEVLSAAGSIIVDEAGLKYVAYIVDVPYTITFIDSDKKTTFDSKYDGYVAIPDVKSDEDRADGMVFVGWKNSAGELVEPVSKDITDDEVDDPVDCFQVKGDETYTAYYEKDITYSFVVDGVITYSHATVGFNYPTDPVKESFTFVGWAVDGQIVFNAGMTTESGTEALEALDLTTDTTFTAVFEPAIYTVSFEVDGQIIATQTVKHGELATEPAFVPALEGMDFVGWDYDFTKAITGDITIVAVFEPTPEPEPTGLDNPTVQIMAIVIGVLVIFLVAVLVWKKDEVRVIIVKRLDKTKNKEEPKQ